MLPRVTTGEADPGAAATRKRRRSSQVDVIMEKYGGINTF